MSLEVIQGLIEVIRGIIHASKSFPMTYPRLQASIRLHLSIVPTTPLGVIQCFIHTLTSYSRSYGKI